MKKSNLCPSRNRMLPWLALTALCAAVSLAAAILSRGQTLANALYMQGTDFILDYSAHLQYVQEPARVYQVNMHACFPPLAYCLYGLLALITPVSFQGEGARMAVQSTPAALLVHLVYLALLICLFTLLARRYLHRQPLWKAAAAICLLLVSNVFVLGLMERGNSAFVVLVLLMAAFLLKDRPSPSGRELALFCIAAAAGLKLYPAAFGLLYLKERRYKEAARLVCYGLVLFFVPFAFFGGLEGLEGFWRNQVGVHATNPNVWTISTLGMGLVERVLALVSPDDVGRFTNQIRLFFMGGFALAGLWLFWQDRRRAPWKDIAILTCLVTLTPSWSGIYTFAYMVIPLLLFFMEDRPEPRLWQGLYTLCFVALFGPLSVLTFHQAEWVVALAGYCLLLLLAAQHLWAGRRRDRRSAIA